MGTKANPGEFDCYASAYDDEPLFTLLARDWSAPYLVEIWAALRVMDGMKASRVFFHLLKEAKKRRRKEDYDAKLLPQDSLPARAHEWARVKDQRKAEEARRCSVDMRKWERPLSPPSDGTGVQKSGLAGIGIDRPGGGYMALGENKWHVGWSHAGWYVYQQRGDGLQNYDFAAPGEVRNHPAEGPAIERCRALNQAEWASFITGQTAKAD